MSFKVTVDWAPAHELLVSFWAFTDSRSLKYFDVGLSWHSTVMRQIGAERTQRITSVGRDKSIRLSMQSLHRACPEPRTEAGFLGWLASLSAIDLAAHHTPDKRKISVKNEHLLTMRDDLVEALDMWNSGYFSAVNKGINEFLGLECRSRREAVLRVDATQAVEDATNGIYLCADLGLREVVLTPQYHCRPYNVHCQMGDIRFCAYPTDLQDDTEAPPPQLERLALALSDASRLRILKFLKAEPRTFMDIVAFSGLARSTVHHHMAALRAAGVVRILESQAGSYYTPRPGYEEAMSRMLKQYIGEPGR